MIGYVVVGVVCLFIGSLLGAFTIALCYAAKEKDETNEKDERGEQ